MTTSGTDLLGSLALSYAERMAWDQDAACKASQEFHRWFFSDGLDDQDYAKHVCARCPAVLACLEFALESNEAHFVWGMHSVKDRKRLVRQLAKHDPVEALERSFERISKQIGLEVPVKVTV